MPICIACVVCGALAEALDPRAAAGLQASNSGDPNGRCEPHGQLTFEDVTSLVQDVRLQHESGKSSLGIAGTGSAAARGTPAFPGRPLGSQPAAGSGGEPASVALLEVAAAMQHQVLGVVSVLQRSAATHFQSSKARSMWVIVLVVIAFAGIIVFVVMNSLFSDKSEASPASSATSTSSPKGRLLVEPGALAAAGPGPPRGGAGSGGVAGGSLPQPPAVPAESPWVTAANDTTEAFVAANAQRLQAEVEQRMRQQRLQAGAKPQPPPAEGQPERAAPPEVRPQPQPEPERAPPEAEQQLPPQPKAQEQQRQVKQGEGDSAQALRQQMTAVTTAATAMLRSSGHFVKSKIRGDGVPSLCPSLVFKDCEARCAVSISKLQEVGSGDALDIRGLSGNLLLRGLMEGHGADATLKVSLTHAGSLPRATIRLIQGDPDTLEICGPHGDRYGTLVSRDDGTYAVIQADQTLMIIDGVASGSQLRASTGTGQPMASVAVSSEYFQGQDHLELCVQPGFDMVLVVSCVLAILLLRRAIDFPAVQTWLGGAKSSSFRPAH